MWGKCAGLHNVPCTSHGHLQPHNVTVLGTRVFAGRISCVNKVMLHQGEC